MSTTHTHTAQETRLVSKGGQQQQTWRRLHLSAARFQSANNVISLQKICHSCLCQQQQQQQQQPVLIIFPLSKSLSVWQRRKGKRLRSILFSWSSSSSSSYRYDNANSAHYSLNLLSICERLPLYRNRNRSIGEWTI